MSELHDEYIRDKLVELDDESYLVDAKVTYETDPSYGEDADGNRGTTRTVVYEVDILNVTDLNGTPVTYKEVLFDKIEEAIIQ